MRNTLEHMNISARKRQTHLNNTYKYIHLNLNAKSFNSLNYEEVSRHNDVM